MKKKTTTRKPWSIERALELDRQRTTTPLTWAELGKQEGMSAGAVRQTMLKYLKQAKDVVQTQLDVNTEKLKQLGGNPSSAVKITMNAEETRAFIDTKIKQVKHELSTWEIIRSLHQ